MKTKKRTALTIILIILAALIVWCAVSLLAGSGLPNLLIRNALAFDRDINDPGFEGQSCEKIPYSDVSESDYLDLYVPDSDEKMPLLILVHGGGFIYNDSQSRQAVLMYQYMRANGYAVATINYRLATEAEFPGPLSDVKAAVRYLRANAELYGYDPDRIAIWGESAGGYLACMAALTEDGEYDEVKFIGEDPDDPVSGRVSALLDFYGVLDFDKIESDFSQCGVPLWLYRLVSGENNLDSKVTKLLGRSITSLTQEELNEISPTYRMSQMSAGSLEVYISHGTVDITVPIVQSVRLYDAALSALGEECVTYREMANLKHADDRFYTPENLAYVKEFLEGVW